MKMKKVILMLVVLIGMAFAMEARAQTDGVIYVEREFVTPDTNFTFNAYYFSLQVPSNYYLELIYIKIDSLGGKDYDPEILFIYSYSESFDECSSDKILSSTYSNTYATARVIPYEFLNNYYIIYGDSSKVNYMQYSPNTNKVDNNLGKIFPCIQAYIREDNVDAHINGKLIFKFRRWI